MTTSLRRFVRPSLTTLCRIAALWLAASTARAQVPGELELVRELLDGQVAREEREAVAWAHRARSTGPGLLDHPTVEARHEQANGPAGASTDVVGLAVTLPGLGVERGASIGAARAVRAAGPAREQAVRLEQICALRREATDLHAAVGGLASSRAAEQRLDALVDALTALAVAGEASGWERDLAALTRVEHHLGHADVEARAAALQAWFGARLGRPVEGVLLEPVDAPTDPGEHPELRALAIERDAAERAVTAAELGMLPDLTLAGGPRWDAFPDGSERAGGYELGLTVQVPVFDRNRRATADARATAAEARASLGSRRAELAAEAAGAAARSAALEHFPDGPEAESIWAAARARWDAGEASVEDLLQAAERVEAASLARVEHARRLRHAELDRACALGRMPAPFDALVQETAR